MSSCEKLNLAAKDTASRIRMWARTMLAKAAGPALIDSMERQAQALEDAVKEHAGMQEAPRPVLKLEAP